MELFVAGLSHHSAPIGLRERIAVTAAAAPAALERLRSRDGCSERLILSTCNRTEVYVRFAPESGRAASAARDRTSVDASLALLAGLHGQAVPGRQLTEELRPHVYTRAGTAAIEHLFRVTSGLESMVLGEHEIARQVSAAYGVARAAEAAGPVLHRVVPRALQVGKRVRTDTAIAHGVTSVAGAAVSLTARVFRDVSRVRIVVVGAGRTARSALSALRSKATGPLVIVNRSAEAAERLATEFGGATAPLGAVHEHVGAADVVIAATDASTPTVRAAPLVAAVRARRGRPLLLLDLGVPRDIEPAVSALDEVFLYDIDALEAVADQGRERRSLHLRQAEGIIRHALEQFQRRRQRWDADPSIRSLLDQLLTLRRDVVDGERGLDAAERAAADRVTGKFVDRLLRRLAPRLARQDATAQALLESFGIDAGELLRDASPAPQAEQGPVPDRRV